MTRELIINGQQADITDDTVITLEYVSSIFEEIGKFRMSRSYTIKLPRTTLNARIFDSPERFGHESSKLRKVLSAQYLQDGVNLIGTAGQARLLEVTPENYEVMLIWDTLPKLSAWYDSKPKLNELTGLGTVKWKGASIAASDNKSDVFFARYNSGAWGPAKNAAPHPCVNMYALLRTMMSNAGINARFANKLVDKLREYALLVAPSHKPSTAMEIQSGAQGSDMAYVTVTGSGSYWWFKTWTVGWDSPATESELKTRTIQLGDSPIIRFILNVKISNASPDMYISLEANGLSHNLVPTRTDDGGYLIDQEVDLKEALELDTYGYCSIKFKGLSGNGSYNISAYDSSKPLFALIKPHEVIQTDYDNRFPIADNLPNIGQYEWLKAMIALFGIVVYPSNGVLTFTTYDAVLNTDNAVDWTEKVDMAEGEGVESMTYKLAEYAQRNVVKYEEDDALPISPDIILKCDDETLEIQKELLKLPVAASMADGAIHYRCHDAWDENGNYYVETEDIEIKPRIFGYTHDSDGKRHLMFTNALQGDGALRAHLARLQKIILKPVVVAVNVRLSFMDLANWSPIIPVYLAQYGRYFAVLKIQTSDTDLCKVELLQLPS